MKNEVKPLTLNELRNIIDTVIERGLEIRIDKGVLKLNLDAIVHYDNNKGEWVVTVK